MPCSMSPITRSLPGTPAMSVSCRGKTIPSSTRIQRWYKSMCATDIFRATSTKHADYRARLIEFYLPYSRGKGQQDVGGPLTREPQIPMPVMRF